MHQEWLHGIFLFSLAASCLFERQLLNAKYCKIFRPKLSEQTRQRSEDRQPIVDRPTQLFYIWIFIWCKYTNVKDAAGQSATFATFTFKRRSFSLRTKMLSGSRRRQRQRQRRRQRQKQRKRQRQTHRQRQRCSQALLNKFLLNVNAFSPLLQDNGN